jgi:hypothetical protein
MNKHCLFLILFLLSVSIYDQFIVDVVSGNISISDETNNWQQLKIGDIIKENSVIKNEIENSILTLISNKSEVFKIRIESIGYQLSNISSFIETNAFKSNIFETTIVITENNEIMYDIILWALDFEDDEIE